MLTFSKSRNRFEFLCSFKEKDIPKGAGFFWDKDNMVWWTKEPKKASSLSQYFEGGSIPTELLKKKIRIFKDGKYWVLDVSFEDKDIAKSNGFWFKSSDKHWVTSDPEVAHKFIHCADDNERSVIESAFQEKVNTFSASKKAKSDSNFNKPDGLDYLPFQKAGIEFSLDKESVLIADEMGLGKTIQAIGVFNNSDAKTCLIVCPAFLKRNWENEFNKWCIKNVSIQRTEKTFPDAQVVIVNYDVMNKFHDEIRSRSWDLLILDEVHYCKNTKALRTKYTFGGKIKVNKTVVRGGKEYKEPEEILISRIESKRRIYLTGTPILNRPAELFPIINSLDPDSWRSKSGYEKRYCKGHFDRWGYWDNTGAQHLDELQKKLRSSIMIRRLKKDVLLELPQKLRQVIEIGDPSSKIIQEEKQIVEKNRKNLEDLYTSLEESKISPNKEDYVNAVKNLKKGYSAMFEDMAEIRKKIAISKIPFVVDHITEILESGNPVVCFTHHREVAESIYNDLSKREFDGEYVHGGVSFEDRENKTKRFQEDQKCMFFIGTMKSCGVGITLTKSSNVVFAEGDWTPANLSQAEDRCHRIGQTESILIQHIVLEGSLDAYMSYMVIDKQNILDKMLDDHVSVDRDIVSIPEPIFILNPSGDFKKTFVDYGDMLKSEKIFEDNPEYISIVESALRIVGGNCDGAVYRDNVGFNKVDSKIGKKLCLEGIVTSRRASYTLHFLLKYKKQIPESTYTKMLEIIDLTNKKKT